MNFFDILAHIDLNSASLIIPTLAGFAGSVACWRRLRLEKKKQEAAAAARRVVWKPQRRR